MTFVDFVNAAWHRFSWKSLATGFRSGESGHPVQLSYIADSRPGERTVSTSIDCYVTGRYVDGRGRSVQVTQRYSINIRYSTSTFRQVFDEVRRRIVADFEQRYGIHGFAVTDVFVPAILELKRPEPVEIYRGRRAWREMTRIERMEYEKREASDVYKHRIAGIRKRYARGY